MGSGSWALPVWGLELGRCWLVGHSVRISIAHSAPPTVKPGVRYRELGTIIQKHAQASGFSVVRSYCGHGIHKLFHTAPNVPHYASECAHVASVSPSGSQLPRTCVWLLWGGWALPSVSLGLPCLCAGLIGS